MTKKRIIVPTESPLWISVCAWLIVLVFIALNRTKIEENDTWWHLALGRWMVQNHQIYRTEIFSQVGMGRSFLAHEWLSEVLFYLFSSPSGKLLSYFKLFLIVVPCSGLGFFLAKPYFRGKLTVPLLLALAFLVTFRAPVRPQIFEIICASCFLVSLNFWKESPSWRGLVGLVPIQILWANLHGSYLLGAVLLFLLAVGISLMHSLPILPGDKDINYPLRSRIELFVFSLILLSVSLINPNHFELLKRSFSIFFLDDYMKEYIREWYSVLRVDKGIWFYVWCGWIGWAWISLLRTLNRVSQLEVYTLLLATIFPFIGVRYITLSALLSAPDTLKRSYALFPKGLNAKVWNFVLIGFACFFFYVGYPMTLTAANPPGAGFNFGVVPTDIIQHIKANNIRGVMMNHYHDGAFVIYYLYPQVLPVIDSRTDFYGQDLFMENSQAYQSMALFNQFVNKYQVNLVLLRLIPETEVLRRNLFESPDWTLEKFGLDNMLFIKVDSNHPRVTMEEMMSEFNRLAKRPKLEESAITHEQTYCAVVRLFGHCEVAPECKELCEAPDDRLSQQLGGVPPLCFKFSHLCFKKETVCGPCPDLCTLYAQGVDRVNHLGFHYPNLGRCF